MPLNLYSLLSQIHRGMYNTDGKVPLLATLMSRNVVDKGRIKHAGVTRRAMNSVTLDANKEWLNICTCDESELQ